MAKKRYKGNENFHSKEYEKLMESLNNNKPSNDLKKLTEEITKRYDSLFKGTKGDVMALVSSNEGLENDYNELNKQLLDLSKMVSSSGRNLKKLSKDFNAPEEQIDLILKKIDEYDSLGKEISDLEKKRDSFGSNTVEHDRYDAIINDKKNKRNAKEASINRTNLGKIIYNEKDSNPSLKRELNLRKKINKKIEESNKSQAKFNEEVYKGEKATEKLNSRIKAIADTGKFFVSIIKTGANKWLDIDDAVFKTGRSIGLATSQIRGYQKNILDNYGDMAANLGMTFEEMFKFQENYTKNTGRAIILTNEEVASLAGMSKLVGEASTNEMVKNMDDLGASTKTASDYLALNRARAQASGLDAAKSSELFAKNIKLAAKYNFREGVNGISKMTLLSQKLKFNMDSIANAAEKFETIEGAISTSANLQMLGGSFANQFGNPLEAMNMAMLDMEGFTNKIIDTFSGKATFNSETGQAEMSAIDKRFLKEAAKQLGISFDEAWNIATQKARNGAIESNLDKSVNFTESDKAFITSNAKFNTETGRHEITYYDSEEGTQKRVEVGDIDKNLLNTIKSQGLSEEQIQGDVKGIRNKLNEYVDGEVKNTKTGKEIKKGITEAYQISIAEKLDSIFNVIKNLGNSFSNGENVGGKALIGSVIGGIGGIILQNSSSVKYIKDFAKGKAGSILGGRGLSGGSTSNFNNGISSGNNRGNRGSRTRGNASNSSGSFIGKVKNWGKGLRGRMSKIPKGSLKSFGKFAIPAGIIMAGASLMSFSSGDEAYNNDINNQNKARAKSGDTTNYTEHNNTIENSNAENGEINELKKQTRLLTLIAESQGVKVNTSYKKEYNTIENDIISGETNSNGLVDLGLGAATMIGKANPYAQIAMGAYDMYNAHSTYKDQINKIDKSNLSYEEKDKLKKQASNKRNERYGGGIGGATGSIIGATIGSALGPIGTAVGAVAGNWIGNKVGGFIGKNYNKAKDFLFGKEMPSADKVQEQYEVTKMGETTISDPQLHQKAALATCKIHDLLITIWNHMNGKQSNGKMKDNGLLGNIGNLTKKSLTNIMFGPLKLVKSMANSIFNPLSDEDDNNYKLFNNLSNKKYNATRAKNRTDISFPINELYNRAINSNFVEPLLKESIYSVPTVGTPTYIKKDNNNISKNSVPLNNDTSNINLTINGTLKLIGDKNVGSIDMNQLLNNPTFKSKLIDMIQQGLNERGNGKRIDKNSQSYIQNGAYDRNVLNGTPTLF